jgi:hypothetical protein
MPASKSAPTMTMWHVINLRRVDLKKKNVTQKYGIDSHDRICLYRENNEQVFTLLPTHILNYSYIVFVNSNIRQHLWSGGQSSGLQIQRSQVRFPMLPDSLRSSGSGTGSTQPHEYNWGATWMECNGSGSRKPRLMAVGIRCVDHPTPSIRKNWH